MMGRLLFYLAMAVGVVIPAAVAYDIASSLARLEAQRAADAAALAGAGTLMATIGDSAQAARAAQEIARRNAIAGSPATLRAGDITLDVPEGIIRVTVRGRAIPFDVPLWPSEVVAEAAAQARAARINPPVSFRRLQLIE